MNTYSEKRADTRIQHETTIMIENYPAGKYYEGRMYNFSRCGIYYESDFTPEPGMDIFIGIENSPLSSEYDVYRATVIWWRKRPKKASSFGYGIGVKFC